MPSSKMKTFVLLFIITALTISLANSKKVSDKSKHFLRAKRNIGPVVEPVWLPYLPNADPKIPIMRNTFCEPEMTSE